jgi:signal transduction histidine kinase
VRVVPTAVRAAVANLLENAVQASPPGSAVEMVLQRRGDEAELVISDHGPGLPPEVRQRLYEPHVTTRIEGSGMGLFLARQLVVAMNAGHLELADGEDGGTVAVVRLPLSVAESEAAAAADFGAEA